MPKYRNEVRAGAQQAERTAGHADDGLFAHLSELRGEMARHRQQREGNKRRISEGAQAAGVIAGCHRWQLSDAGPHSTRKGFAKHLALHRHCCHPPMPATRNTATQMATPSIQALCARSSGSAAPSTVEICKAGTRVQRGHQVSTERVEACRPAGRHQVTANLQGGVLANEREG